MTREGADSTLPPEDGSNELAGVVAQLRAFTFVRKWEQFHTPKNLSMALAGEVGELISIFQWLTPEATERVMDRPGVAEDVRDELADVAIYLLLLADKLDVDLLAEVRAKVDRNEIRFPAETTRGRAFQPGVEPA